MNYIPDYTELHEEYEAREERWAEMPKKYNTECCDNDDDYWEE